MCHVVHQAKLFQLSNLLTDLLGQLPNWQGIGQTYSVQFCHLSWRVNRVGQLRANYGSITGQLPILARQDFKNYMVSGSKLQYFFLLNGKKWYIFNEYYSIFMMRLKCEFINFTILISYTYNLENITSLKSRWA